MELSTAAARAVCTAYAGRLRNLLSKPLNQGTTKQLGEAIGRLWLDAYMELEKLDGDRRHVPSDGRTAVVDLDDVVSKRTSEIFEEIKPTWENGTRANCVNSTYRKVFMQLLEQKHKGAAANRAAAEQYISQEVQQPPAQDPDGQRQHKLGADLAEEAIAVARVEHVKLHGAEPAGSVGAQEQERALLEAAAAILAKRRASAPTTVQAPTQSPAAGPGSGKNLVQLLMSRADGTAEPEEQGQPSGNGSGGPAQRAAAVPPPLAHAAQRLMNPGPPDLRVQSSNGELALHMLQEKWSLTEWAEAQGLSGAALREAKTHARSMELGVKDFGVGYLLSRSAEVQARRMLALALTQASGNYRLGAQLEELPGEGVLSTLPDSLVRSLSERLKLELKLEQMSKEGLRK
jgi:hypothetical protein